MVLENTQQCFIVAASVPMLETLVPTLGSEKGHSRVNDFPTLHFSRRVLVDFQVSTFFDLSQRDRVPQPLPYLVRAPSVDERLRWHGLGWLSRGHTKI